MASRISLTFSSSSGERVGVAEVVEGMVGEGRSVGEAEGEAVFVGIGETVGVAASAGEKIKVKIIIMKKKSFFDIF